MMEYYFNNLDPTGFQRLVNAVLVARFGDDVRLLPLRGADGGRDAETPILHPTLTFEARIQSAREGLLGPITKGRYLFQVKHHRTSDGPIAAARSAVVADFSDELQKNVLPRSGEERVNYFFLVTNVPSSKDSVKALDEKRRALLLSRISLHADVWWQADLVARLDQLPRLWSAFPELFAGGVVPFLGQVANEASEGLPKAFRLAIAHQYSHDRSVRFHQIDLNNSLARLFVDLDVDSHFVPASAVAHLRSSRTGAPNADSPWQAGLQLGPPMMPQSDEIATIEFDDEHVPHGSVLAEGPSNLALRPIWFPSATARRVSAMGALTNERDSAPKDILLEGGPGQGKSTISQMVAQVYREALLRKSDLDAQGRWKPLEKSRVPIRLDLRGLGEWLGADSTRSVDEYIAFVISQDSGGRAVRVEDLHDVASKAPMLVIFDGLDEIGTDEIRDLVLTKVSDLIERFRGGLNCDLRTVITTRPPAIAGRREQIPHFARLPLAPLSRRQVDDYLERWLSVQFSDQQEGKFVRASFTRRRSEPHVSALSMNPMQLSVLLHFIRLKGEAFPDRRADLYREYFRTVIDRDVVKSERLRQNRENIETLHELVGFKIHILTQSGQADGSLPRPQLLRIVADWLASQGTSSISAEELFAVGEERLGLIAAIRGEGQQARYGYEIQPIREYFAAAFINEQIQGDAHEVFPGLVRRSYWREVALFLAGLRRPNERADLLSRARDLDNDPELGWRQDGRSIILHLTQEGVLSQPRHVYTDALSFLLGAADPRESCGRYEIKELLPALPALIRNGDMEFHLRQILEMLADGRHSGDEYRSMRILGLAAQVLDGSAARRAVMAYRVPSLALLGRIRLVWSLRFGVDLRQEAVSEGFWQDREGSVWARALWTAAMLDSRAMDLPFPASYHSRLIEELVLNPLPVDRSRTTASRPASDRAVWQMASSQQMLANLLGALTERRVEAVLAGPALGDCNVVGLPDPLRSAIQLLVSRSADVLTAIQSRRPGVGEIVEYIAAIRDLLTHPGLECWLAWRSFSSLAGGFPRRPRRLGGGLAAHLNQEPAWQALKMDIAQMLGVPDSRSAIMSHKISFAVPHHVLLEDAKPAPVSKVLIDKWTGVAELPFDWMSRIPLTGSLVQAIVREGTGKLDQILAGLSHHDVSPTQKPSGLAVQSIQRVLAAARRAKSEDVLSGALAALLGSRFLKIAGAALTLRMIRASSATGDLGPRLFAGGQADWDAEDRKMLHEIAASILADQGQYSGNVASSAAGYLLETETLVLPPLSEQEERLGLYPQRPGPR